MKIRATLVKAKDLQPGDLFSTAGPEYWDLVQQKRSIGERVYIRTESETPPDQAEDPIYLITIET